jgi:hypothetical protein
MPSKTTWATVQGHISTARSDLETVRDDLQDEYDEKSDKWREGEAGEAMADLLSELEDSIIELEKIEALIEEQLN